MTTTNEHYNAEPARPAIAWKQRLGMGIIAWVALGVATALLDPRAHGAGVIGLFGGVAPWLATGAGLAVAYTVGHTVHGRAGRIAGLVVGSLSLAVVVAILALTDWQTVTSGIMTLVCGAIGLALFLRAPTDSFTTISSADDSICGWRNDGPFGAGYYAGNLPLEDDDD